MNFFLETLRLIGLSIYYTLESIFLLFIPVRKKNVSGEIVLITGAGNGIGRLLALKFARLGATLVLWDLNLEGNKETARLAKKMGAVRVHDYICDCSKRQEIYRVADQVKKEVGDVSILINNAGIVTGNMFLECPDSLIEKTMEVNAMAHFWVTNLRDFHLIWIEAQFIGRHPAHYLSQALVQHSHCLTWSRCKREVELGVISILVTPQPKPPNDLSQWFHVDVEKHGGQNRALQKPMAHLPWRRAIVPQHHLLESASQTVKAFLPAMIASNHGHLVTVASMAGLTGVNGLADYCASKFASVGFAESLILELLSMGKTGIKSTIVCPYFINTGMFDGCQTKWPVLLPILEPEYVAERIVSGILRNDLYILLPRSLYFLNVVKGIAPTKICLLLGEYLGVFIFMDKFRGRSKKIEDNKYQKPTRKIPNSVG
ncbi:Epidermal retinol dehydrogenase 2 [Varanus komodoensis]|nr:Epidermal retinol dehydrogenase 2 [Varanus komodoensis]